MNPLEIDHILERVLEHIHCTRDLLSCRCLNTTWCSLATPRLATRGLRLGLDNDTIRKYYHSLLLEEAVWTRPPFSEELSIYITGNRAQNLDTIKYASYLLTDPSLDSPRKIKSIRVDLQPCAEIDQEQLWAFVHTAAPDLEELHINGGFLRLMPPAPPGINDLFPVLTTREIPVSSTPFPCLLRASYALRRQLDPCTHCEGPVPVEFIEIINAAPRLETLSLMRNDGEPVSGDLTQSGIYFLPKLRTRSARSLTELELAIYRPEELTMDDGANMSDNLYMGLCLASLDQLKYLKIHQHFSYCFMERFLTLYSEAPTLTSIEYYFLQREDATTEDLDVTLPEGPAELPNITHFGLYFLENVVNRRETQPVRLECLSPQIRGLTHLREDEFFRSAHPGIEKTPAQVTANAAMRFMKNVYLMSRLCPNIRTLSTDLAGCVVLASVAKPPASDGRFLIPFYNGVIVNDMRTEFPLVETLTVKVSLSNSSKVDEGLSTEFATRVTQAWSKLCPLLHKLVLNFYSTEWSQSQSLGPGILPALLGIGAGIEELEMHDCDPNWLADLILQDSGSLPHLRANLKELTMLTPTSVRLTRRCGQREKLSLKRLTLLIDSFPRLEEVTLERSAVHFGPEVHPDEFTYKNTQIHFK